MTTTFYVVIGRNLITLKLLSSLAEDQKIRFAKQIRKQIEKAVSFNS